jgi:hypothetical protein
MADNDKIWRLQVPLMDSGFVNDSKKNAAEWKLPRRLNTGNYYFRVRYQDSAGAWGLWSKENAFSIKDKSKMVNIGVAAGKVLLNPNEILSKRTETTKTIDNKNKSYTLESYSGVIHYKDDYKDSSPSAWKDINPSHYVDYPGYIL